jgi:hypothetical protein
VEVERETVAAGLVTAEEELEVGAAGLVGVAVTAGWAVKVYSPTGRG